MKNKILSLIFALFVMTNIAFSEIVTEEEPTRPIGMSENVEIQNENLNEVQDEQNESTKAIKTINANDIMEKSAKSPYQNNRNDIQQKSSEFSKLVLGFLKTMLAVIIASTIIYLILFMMKKFNIVPANSGAKSEISDNLTSAKNEDEALKIFLNKTK